MIELRLRGAQDLPVAAWAAAVDPQGLMTSAEDENFSAAV
jgi:hypothetical protein